MALVREGFVSSFLDPADQAAYLAALESSSGLAAPAREAEDGREGAAMTMSDKPGGEARLPSAGTTEAGHVVSRDELLRLLAELRGHLPQAGLDADTARILDHDLKVAEEHASGLAPRGVIIRTRLSGVDEVLRHTAEAVEHVQQVLLPLIRRASDFALHLFQ